MQAQENPVIQQMKAQLNRSQMRLIRLETDSTKIELVTDQSTLSQQTFKKSIDNQFLEIEDKLSAVRNEILQVERTAVRLTNSFKELVKNEQLSLLSQRIDTWDLESFMTKDEFERILKERFSRS